MRAHIFHSIFYWMCFTVSAESLQGATQGYYYVKEDSYAYRYNKSRAKLPIKKGTKVRVVAASRKGWCLIQDKRGRKWSINDRDLQKELVCKEEEVDTIIAGDGDAKPRRVKTLHLNPNEKQHNEKTTIESDGCIENCLFSANGKYFYIVTNWDVKIYTSSTGRLSKEFKYSGDAIISANGNFCFVMWGGTVDVYRLPAGDEIISGLKLSDSSSTGNPFCSRDGKILGMYHWPKHSDVQSVVYCLLSSRNSLRHLKSYNGQGIKYDIGVLSNNNKYLVLAERRGTLYLIDIASGNFMTRIQNEKGVDSVVFSPDSKYLFTQCKDTLYVIDLLTQKVIKTIKNHYKVAEDSFSKDGTKLLTYTYGIGDRSVNIIDVKTGEVLSSFELRDTPRHLVFMPDEQSVIAVFYNGVSIHRIIDGEKHYQFDTNGLRSLSKVIISPDQKHCIISAHRKIQITSFSAINKSIEAELQNTKKRLEAKQAEEERKRLEEENQEKATHAARLTRVKSIRSRITKRQPTYSIPENTPDIEIALNRLSEYGIVPKHANERDRMKFHNLGNYNEIIRHLNRAGNGDSQLNDFPFVARVCTFYNSHEGANAHYSDFPPSVLYAFLKIGASVDVLTKYNDSALTQALRYEHYNLMPILLDHGIPVNLRNSRGNTILDELYNTKYPSSVEELLISYGAKLSSEL